MFIIKTSFVIKCIFSGLINMHTVNIINLARLVFSNTPQLKANSESVNIHSSITPRGASSCKYSAPQQKIINDIIIQSRNVKV